MLSLTRRDLMIAVAAASVDAGLADAASRNPFAALEAKYGGRIGVAGLDAGSGAHVLHRADERFPMCSTFKLIAVSAVLTRAARDSTLLARVIPYAASDLVPYSPITRHHVGQGMRVSALCAAALQYSDNTAANLILRLIGGPAGATAFARSVGDTSFRLDRWETALNDAVPGDPRDTSTPAAMMGDLHRALLGDLLGVPERRQLAAWMRGCTTGGKRIRAAVPGGWDVADKTGSGDYGTANDIAVIWPPGKAPIVLAVYFTEEKKGAPYRDDVVAASARAALAMLGHAAG